MIPSLTGPTFYRISDSKLQFNEFTVEPQITALNTPPNTSHTDLLAEAAHVIQAIPQNFVALSKEWRSQWRPRHSRQVSLYLNSKDELIKLPASRIKFTTPREVASVHGIDQPLEGSHFWCASLFDGSSSCFALWTRDTLVVIYIYIPAPHSHSLQTSQLYPLGDDSALSKGLSFQPDVGGIKSVDIIDMSMKHILVSGSVSTLLFFQVTASEFATGCFHCSASGARRFVQRCDTILRSRPSTLRVR